MSSRDDQLAMLSRVEWLVLRSTNGNVDQRWFARLSAFAPEAAFRITAPVRITLRDLTGVV